MTFSARLFFLYVLAALPVQAAWSQVTPVDRQAAVRATLRADARARIVEEGDSLLVLRTVRRGGTRVDTRSGRVRADYRIATRLAAPPADAEAAARAYLAEHASRYGLAPDLADLQVVRVVRGAYSSHVTFAQTVEGTPVYGREVQVNLDRNRQPVMVLSAYEPALRQAALVPAQLTAADAEARARALLTEDASRVDVREMVVVPVPQARRAWRVVAQTAQAVAEWELLIDAATGEALIVIERSTHGAHGSGRGIALEASLSEKAAPTFSLGTTNSAGPRMTRVADGTGTVFDPDPLTSAGVSYGGAYADNDDADTPELTAQLRTVTLRDITVAGGIYTLSGPYVRIAGDDPSGRITYTPPQSSRPDGFRFTRSEDGFEGVMVYYHVDAAQRRVQALGIGRPVLQRQVVINPHGLSSDDSKFYPASGRIYFGTGAIDDAEDADVIWHEYAHALLHDSQPALYQAQDGTAFHEGWADYWAGSYSRGLIERGQGAGDWRRLFPWDGNNAPSWCGRRLDHPGTYDPVQPDKMSYPPLPGCFPFATLYQRGMLWATTLMDVYDAVGQDVTDRLSVASHAFMGAVTAVPAFEVGAEALLAADQTLYDGQHQSTLLRVLDARGYIDAEMYGPLLAHDPLVSTEQAGGTRAIAVEARGASSPVTGVTVRYRYNGGDERDQALDAQSGDMYAGALPVPATAATITYFIEAYDAQGRRTRLPGGAPQEVFTFTSGPDQIAPAIAHTPRTAVPLAAWPFELHATITDNLGVDTVEVVFDVLGAGGSVTASGRFGLARVDTLFRGVWPVDALQLDAGDRVRYYIEARDRAQVPNVARLPAVGTFEIDVVEKGVLAVFDAETVSDGVTAGGAWQQGTPTFGLHRARTGTGVWMTTLGGSYPQARSASILSLPPFDLRGPAAFLVFWHWYDLEKGGQCATLCDGGVVQISTDGGVSWSAAPASGYTGTLDAGVEPQWAGLEAFGGYAYGWQRSVVPLPAQAEVRVRFVLATDAGNIYPSRYGYAGWAIDDIAITTLLPEDDAPPQATRLPPAVDVRPAGTPTLPFSFDVVDETGVARAEMRYAYTHDGTTLRDTLRLEQSLFTLDRFTGTLVFPAAPYPGDNLRYTLVVVDVDGNEQTYPAQHDFEVRFRTMQHADLLGSAQSVGGWTHYEQGWQLAEPRARAALVFEPQDLPANSEAMFFELRHQYNLGVGAGGNVKLSADGGASWQVIEPEGGYPAQFIAPGHPMEGQHIFTGSADTLVSRFDLAPFAGRQVRLRVDFGTLRELGTGEFWRVDGAGRYAITTDALFDIPRAFALYMPRPNPFGDHAVLTYTLDAEATVLLEVYDVLGRRVALLLDGEAQRPGTYTVPFDASLLGSGVYFVRLQAGGQQQTQRVVRVR